MKKSITLEQAMPLMVEMLAAGKEVTFVPSGSSMLPLIHGGKDKITLKKPVLPPAKYDVPLYRRSDGSYVLHRIIGKKNGSYVMCGDHQTNKEYHIKPQDVIAVMTSLERHGKYIDCKSFGYQMYSRIWTFLRPLRPLIFASASFIFRIRSKIFGTKN